MTKTETRDHQPLNLGRIDITSDHVSFRELEEALENSTESVILKAVLDGGKS